MNRKIARRIDAIATSHDKNNVQVSYKELEKARLDPESLRGEGASGHTTDVGAELTSEGHSANKAQEYLLFNKKELEKAVFGIRPSITGLSR